MGHVVDKAQRQGYMRHFRRAFFALAFTLSHAFSAASAPSSSYEKLIDKSPPDSVVKESRIFVHYGIEGSGIMGLAITVTNGSTKTCFAKLQMSQSKMIYITHSDLREIVHHFKTTLPLVNQKDGFKDERLRITTRTDKIVCGLHKNDGLFILRKNGAEKPIWKSATQRKEALYKCLLIMLESLDALSTGKGLPYKDVHTDGAPP